MELERELAEDKHSHAEKDDIIIVVVSVVSSFLHTSYLSSVGLHNKREVLCMILINTQMN